MKKKNINISNIITFKETLLPLSETFVNNQTSSLKEHNNHYVALRTAKPSLDITNSPSFIIRNNNFGGKIKEILFKRYGLIPKPLLKEIKRIKPDLCHAHFGPDAVYALTITKKLKIPLIVTFHGYDATSLIHPRSSNNFKQRNYFKHKNKLINNTSIFIAVSNFIKNKLLEQNYPEDKIITHYIGINTTEYKPNPNIKREKKILFVGRLVEKKGCQYLIKAFTKISKEIPDAQLIIIGDGPLRQSLEDQASKAAINYQFLGSQSSKQVNQWMCKSHILCVPSVEAINGDSEGFGMVFIEAQAVGTPVVSFKSGGIVEAVSHQKTGLLAEEKDWKTLAKYLMQLLEDQPLWLKFSKAGRRRVQEKFDLEKQTAKLEKIYKQYSQNNKSH